MRFAPWILAFLTAFSTFSAQAMMKLRMGTVFKIVDVTKLPGCPFSINDSVELVSARLIDGQEAITELGFRLYIPNRPNIKSADPNYAAGAVYTLKVDSEATLNSLDGLQLQ